MQDSKLEERKNQFQKNNANILNARQEYKLSLRKKTIDDFILRRREKMQEKNEMHSKLEIDPEKLTLPLEILNRTDQPIDALINFTKDLIKSNDIDYVMYGVFLIRKHLSLERNPPLMEFVNSNIVEELLICLDRYISCDSIVYEILWCLTNITAAANSEVIGGYFLTPKVLILFENIIYSKNTELISILLWLVSHIVTDCESTRDGIINSNFFLLVLNLLEDPAIDLHVLKYGLWLMASISRVTPNINADKTLERSVRIVCQYIKSEDPEIVTNSIWALAGLSDTRNMQILSMIVDSGILPKLLSLDAYNSKNMIEPPLRILGNLLTSDDILVEQLINLGCIPFLFKNINSKYRPIIRDTLWALSNIAAGTLSQIKQLIEANIIPHVCNLVRHYDLDIVKEAIWTITNCISGSDFETCVALCNFNVLDEMIYVLTNISDPLILKITLKGLRCLFSHGEPIKQFTTKNPIIEAFNAKNGMDLLEALQNHNSMEVYREVNKIMVKFYDTVEVKPEQK